MNRRRIFGYNRSYLVDFDFNDKNEENVAKFMSLTPANKVLLLQTATTDDNLFKRLIVNIKDVDFQLKDVILNKLLIL